MHDDNGLLSTKKSTDYCIDYCLLRSRRLFVAQRFGKFISSNFIKPLQLHTNRTSHIRVNMPPPVARDADLQRLVDDCISQNKIMVFSKTTCGFCRRVSAASTPRSVAFQLCVMLLLLRTAGERTLSARKSRLQGARAQRNR